MKVPIAFSELSENGLLERALKLLGMRLSPESELFGPKFSISKTAFFVKDLKECTYVRLEWSDKAMLTLSQLAELGFELGDTKSLSEAIARHELIVSSFAEMPLFSDEENG